MTIGLGHYLSVAAILFTLGVLGIFLNRKNVIVILMSIELILLAVNINLVAFSSFLGDIVGLIYALIVLTVAAAEAAIGLAILVALPLIGAIIAGVITLVGARNRFPGASPPPPHDDHAALPVPTDHARAAPSPRAAPAVSHGSDEEEVQNESAAAGSRAAELITTTLLVISCVLSWYAFYDVGLADHEARVPLFSFISFGDLHSEWSLRIDSLTAVMLVVVTTVSSLVHLYSIGYMADDPYRPRFFCY